MACNCYGEIEAKVKEMTADPEAEVGYAITGIMSGNASTRPRMGYTYRKTKKDGQFIAKKYQGTLLPTYCPFCGVK